MAFGLVGLQPASMEHNSSEQTRVEQQSLTRIQQLNQREKHIDKMEKCVSTMGRALQGFVADSDEKEQEILRLETEVKKKEQRIKDLTDQLEAHEMTKITLEKQIEDQDYIDALATDF